MCIFMGIPTHMGIPTREGLDEVGEEEDGAEGKFGAEEHRAVPTYPAQKNLVQKNIVRCLHIQGRRT